MSKASVFHRRRFDVRQVVLTKNGGNEFVAHNLLHDKSHKLGARNSTVLCCLLKVLDFQRNGDVHESGTYLKVMPPGEDLLSRPPQDLTLEP